MGTNCAKWLEAVCATPIKSAGAMTAPRAREQNRPPSPPDRLPPRRGGRPSSRTCSAAGRPAGLARLAGARRGLLRPARALAAAALLALTGALALPATAEAQTATTLVSNTGQSADDAERHSRKIAQVFTTGSNEDGYTLTGVDIVSASSSSFTAMVCETVAPNSYPTSPCEDLDPPGSFAAGTMTFTPMTGSTFSLVKDTIYAVVVEAAEDHAMYGRVQGWSTTSSDSEDMGFDDEWSIRNSYYRNYGPGATDWSNDGKDVSLLIAIKGTAVGGTLSSDATLSGLTVTAGGTDLVTFASGTTDYAASVANAVAEVTVTAMTTDSGATIEYLDGEDATLTDADTGVTDLQVALAVGETVIKVKVTAEDGNATQTYMVTVDRAAAMTPTCTLNAGDLWCGVVTVGAVEISGLTLGYGFSPADGAGALSNTGFSVGSNPYTIDIVTTGVGTNAGVLNFSLTSALTATDKAKLVLHVGSASFAFSDRTPSDTYTYQWNSTGLDWSSTSEVTLRLREAASSDATLSDLVVNDGTTDLTLTPTFESGMYTYTASVVSTVAEVTVTPTKNDSGASIEYLDGDDATLTDAGTDAGHQVAVAGSETVIKVKVTAEDGNATQTYMVTVTRAAATCTAPDLTGQQQIWTATLTVGTSATNWGFDSTSSPPIGALSDTDFDVDLTGATNSYTFTKIRLSVAEVPGFGRALGLILGSNLADADLAGLTLHVCDSDFTLSSATHNATLNSYNWWVSGSDWSTYATRTLYLSVPAASSDATLSDLVVNDGTTDLTLTPTFESGMYTYTASVVSTVAEVTVTPTKNDSGATIEYLDASDTTLDDADTTDTGHQVAVAEGDTVIKVKVTAEDGNATQTYMVTVTRAAAGTCTDNEVNLAYGLDDSEGKVRICHNAEWRGVCDDGFDSGSTAAIDNGSAFAGVVCRQLGYATGKATIQSTFGSSFASYWLDDVVCTGTEANLGACAHAGWGVENCSAPENAGVRCTVAASGLTATPGDDQMALAWDAPGNDAGITRHEVRHKTAAGSYPAAWTAIPDSAANGTNEASYTVTGLASGTDYTFQVRIVGGGNESEPDEVAAATTGTAVSTDATLSDLVVNDGTTDLTLTPTFASGMYTYTASVVSTVAEVTVTPTKNDSGATIEYLDGDDATLTDAGTDAGHQVAVAEGDTVIKVKVTAEDGNATQTYMVTVKRAAADASTDATLSDLVVNDGNMDLTLMPGFASSTIAYMASVATAVTEVTVTATPNDSGATIEYLGASPIVTLEDADTGVTGHQVAVAVGETVIQVKVTAEDGVTTQTYTVTVNRAAAMPPTCTLKTGDIWCGVVAVGQTEIPGVGTTRYGFIGAVGDLSDNDGDKTFTIGMNPYTIDRVTVATEIGGGGTPGYLIFGLTSALTATDKENLVLHVGSASFALRDAAGPSAAHDYGFGNSTLDWSSESTVTLRLREADATLSALVVNDGRRDLTLRPGFAPGTTSYRVWVVNDVAEVTVMATPNNAGATIEYLDASDMTLADVDTSDTVQPVTLAEGDNVVKVKVTATDTTTTRTYTVTVTRRAVDAPGVEGDLRLTDEDLYTHPDGHVGVAGRVEIFHNGHWGTVCDDGFSRETTSRFVPDLDADDEPTGTFTETTPDNEAPALVCESMGYDTGEYASGYGQPGDSQESELASYSPVGRPYPLDWPPVPIWLDDLTCAADDADQERHPLPAPLAHCAYAGWGLHNCSHREDAGVRCWNVEDIAPAAVAEPLTAAFEGLPEAHDGETAFSFRLAFSEAVAVTPEAMRTRVLTVAGGAATGAARVDGESGVWEITVTPDSREDLSIALAPTEDCEAEGAVCTSDGRALSVVPAHIVPGPGPETEPALTASFEGLPEAHDGEEGFHFRVAFSEDIGIGFRSMRDDSFTVDGGEVTRARRVDRRHDLWRITVEPDGEGDVTVTLAAGRECAVSGAICTRGGDRRQLTNTATATVAGPVDEDAPAVLTASFVEAPHEHDGETAFKLRIAFSEGISIGFRTFRDQSLSVSGGSVTKAKRVDRRRDLWEVTVKPGSLGDVTVTLAGGRACGTAGAVCTGDGRALSATISTTVLGPVALSVADARVREASDVTLDFAVTLSRASRAPVAVAYATADGSATAGSDYTATSGTLTFAAGETAKTVSVPVLDDAHDEGEETLTLRLSAATGAVIADGVATGTIENTDHMPAAWLARFGRTVTDQVLSVVEARLAAPRTAGARATLAGQALPSWDDANDNAKAAAGDNADASDRALRADARDREAMTAIRDWMAHAGADGAWRAPGEGSQRADLVQSRALTGRDFLTGTSFALTGGSAEAGGYAALWGRGAISRFDGREGDLTLDGEVTTALMGADWAAERWTAGLAIGHARGTGGYSEGGGCTAGADDNGANGCAGEVEATLSGVWPYAGLTLTDRLSAWAAAGYGAGSLTLTPGGESPFTADLTMAMGAAGMRGEVLTPPPEGGLALVLKGDARFTRTASEATKDAEGVGNLAAASADVWLMRTGIEGSRRFAPGGAAAGLVLTPSFELGVRLDGGDAETGLGVDLGGGLAFAAPKQGIALDLKARGLVAHEAPGFREWGASASLAWDPRPSTDRGLALTLRQSWGGSPTGGMDALLGRETLAGLAANENGDTTASAGRLEAELGYGIAMFEGGFTGTPHLGVGLSDTGRDYRLGWRLTSARRGGPGLEIGLAATRSETANDDEAPQHGLMLRGAIRW